MKTKTDTIVFLLKGAELNINSKHILNLTDQSGAELIQYKYGRYVLSNSVQGVILLGMHFQLENALPDELKCSECYFSIRYRCPVVTQSEPLGSACVTPGRKNYKVLKSINGEK